MAPISRRLALKGGLAASLWAFAPGARAEGAMIIEAGPATGSDGAAPGPGLAYNGASPGPLIRIVKGAPLRLRLVNMLARPTNLAFPGLRAANANMGMGGLVSAPLAPGASQDISFTPPDSGFNLYMPCLGRDSREQIARGLFGALVVEEASPPAADLESVVVLAEGVDDKGAAGATVSANGAPAPLNLTAAPGARVRLRLANAATARAMTLVIEGVKSLVIAVDGQPADAFEPLRNLVPLAPGARVELMFDLPREPAPSAARLTLRGADAGAAPDAPDQPLIGIEAKGEPLPPRPPLSGLPANPLLPAEIALERARRIDLTLSGGGETGVAVNGSLFPDWGAKPLFQVSRGTPVTLGLANTTKAALTMRLGGHVARLLHGLDDGWEPYWRDILFIPPGKTIHAAFVADNPGKWPLESASPERRDLGLAGWFQVV